jgi:hypothetical protein
MASGSLLLTTSQRLSRSIERTRKLSDKMREMIRDSTTEKITDAEIEGMFHQLETTAHRAKLLQKAMSTLYITLFFFIATCISIAIVFVSNTQHTWLPFVLGIVGVGLLFYASVILIIESRIALSAVDVEMEQTLLYFRKLLPDLKKAEKLRWWKRLAKFKKE